MMRVPRGLPRFPTWKFHWSRGALEVRYHDIVSYRTVRGPKVTVKAATSLGVTGISPGP